MKNLLIVGSNSEIAGSLIEMAGDEFNIYSISRSEKDIPNHYVADIMNDDLPELDVELDGLVYFPGTITLKPFRGLKPEDFRRDFEINLVGAVKVINKYLKNLSKSGNASVVLFSSVAATKGMNYHASIASSKAAVEGLARSLAAEYAAKIRFNVIAPSLTDTALAERLLRTDSQRESSAAMHPMKRTGKPEDIASATRFLLSDESGWLTGQVIGVDGGLSTLNTK